MWLIGLGVWELPRQINSDRDVGLPCSLQRVILFFFDFPPLYTMSSSDRRGRIKDNAIIFVFIYFVSGGGKFKDNIMHC